ncbi:MAG: TOMM precursor leader peptide-binding protein [Gammaproteobacteria bacterium]|jgi:thiazole/oxazole-forming peptide maturase SagC family component|nr:TOMM precursor leader peptide-binding protein [Gammaproteobacteria bacterium]MBT4145367.1 TOMM precursor leader peptide-binding protein [Gammaproteobacteria bacterium]MBT5221952.1 TOMM precursor leader peptide-binding protein [Gammaproteobacteria bacterium]MBT5825230.1 TOMM precursor leader peptide-binding protein [Gammaproteobacteria bacterium]MBT5966939.1 TOMM precursor leader peptide-binding protein [Gammaproteobacteria bacterium]
MTLKLFTYPVDIIESTSGIQLVRGANRFIIRDERSSTIVRLIVALSSEGIILDELISEFSEPDKDIVRSLVEALIERRLAYYADQATAVYGLESPLDIFIWHFDKPRQVFNADINQASIILVGINLLSITLFETLNRSGFTQISFIDDPLLRNIRLFDELGQIKDLPEISNLVLSDKALTDFSYNSVLVLPCSDFGGSTAFRQWNTLAHQQEFHLLPISMHDLRGFIGPYIIPNSAPCYECLIARENANLIDYQEEAVIGEQAHTIQLTTSAYTEAMLQTLAGIAVMEVVKIFTSIMLCPTSELINISLLEPSITRHPVLKIPRCPCCSPAEWRPDINVSKNEFKQTLLASE